MRGVCGRAIDRAPHNGHAATAAAHVRVRLAMHVRIEPPSVQNASGSRAHEPLHDTTAHGLAAAAQVTKSQLRLVDDHPASACDHGSDHSDHYQRAEELPTLLPAAKLLQPPSAAKQPNPAVEPG